MKASFPKRIAYATFGAFAFLTACSTPIVTACPPIKSYTQEFQNRLADELAALPTDSALGAAIIDYKALRDQLRACR